MPTCKQGLVHSVALVLPTPLTNCRFSLHLSLLWLVASLHRPHVIDGQKGDCIHFIMCTS